MHVSPRRSSTARGSSRLSSGRRHPRRTLRVRCCPRSSTALDKAGLFAVGAPTALGGPDVDIDTMFEIGYELARGCASTAWCWGLWASHSWFMGFASEQLQEEVYADGPAVRLSSGANPNGAVIEEVEGGCLLSGRWGFSSGVDHAGWVMFGGMIPGAAGPRDTPVLMLVPRDEVTVEDDWFVMGLKGTGSKTVALPEPVFVPEHRFLKMNGAESGPARTVHGRASYGLPVQMPVHFVVAAPLLGAARAAVDTLSEEMKTRRHSWVAQASKVDSAGVQMRIAMAAGEVDSALNLARSDLREFLALGARGGVMTEEQRAACRLHHAHIALQARRAVDELFEISGTAGLFTKAPMPRLFSDVWAGSKQIALMWDEAAESYGRVRLGLEANAMFR